MSENKMYLTKIVGAFIFVFGIFFLLLSVVNIFNDVEFIQEYKACIEVSKFDPSVIDTCKANVSDGLNVVIRSNQVELSTGQYLKVYIKEIIEVLLAVLLIIVGDFIFQARTIKKREEKAIVKPVIKSTKRVVRKKKKK
ncbi:hypothetical protein M0P25_01555 [archaeon]|jgi:hypothetical protein|nr:hypothetical protein [archaeon]MDD2477696.1 hypothetical protein [Candidatus ainarchaeum sp.]MDD3084549.1 hypothetical protein [Candidatus ainarchaeum sp.]MDD4221273.1 hypothetical protein [Candidatus ainarchaeum sp.]MDD4662794.1 hypothetical protein [Candidatus ainarchaeum sp.]